MLDLTVLKVHSLNYNNAIISLTMSPLLPLQLHDEDGSSDGQSSSSDEESSGWESDEHEEHGEGKVSHFGCARLPCMPRRHMLASMCV